MGRIRMAYLLCTRIALETITLRVTWKLRSRRAGVFFYNSQYVFPNALMSQKRFSFFLKNRDVSPRLGPKHRSWTKRIMYRSINMSKRKYSKCALVMNSICWIQPAYLPCTRITLEITDLRITQKLRSRRSDVFQKVQVCGSECFWCHSWIVQM